MYLVSYSESFDDAVGVCCRSVESFKEAVYSSPMKYELYLGEDAIITTPIRRLNVIEHKNGVKSVRFNFSYGLFDKEGESREVYLIPVRYL